MKILLRCLLVCALLAAHLFYVQAAHAATFTVTNRADTNDGVCNVHCSLREAVTAANNAVGDDTIGFLPGLSGQVTLNTVLPTITGSLTLSGGSPNIEVARNPASNAFRIFEVAPESSFRVSNITISNGAASKGAGIHNDGGTLTVIRCLLQNNRAADEGGGIHNNGLNGEATAIITESVFRNNQADSNGGGGFFNHARASAAKATITGCTFVGNAAARGGAIYNYGDFNIAPLTLTNCTFSVNTATLDGGALLTDSAFFISQATSFVHSCTFVSNSAPSGGAIKSVASGVAQLHNTLFDNNDLAVDSFEGAIVSHGYNLSDDDGDGFLRGSVDIINTEPLPGPLQNNGGPTPTHALRFGSPAINAGIPYSSRLPEYDQRGVGFPRVRNERADVGAYEYEIPLFLTINDVTITESNPAQGAPGESSANFEVRLSIPSDKTVTVNATTSNGTAKAPGDYTSSSTTLSFAPGETSKTFSVPVQGDLLDEADKVFYVLLSSPVNAPVARGRGVGTIQDDDETPAISIERVIMREGNSGQRTAAFRLTLSAPSGQVVRVNYSTIAGNATPGDDYVEVTSKQVAFNTGSIYAYAPVLINGDELNELNEYFKVQLSDPQNVYISDGEAEGFIGNDDRAPSLAISDAQITEGPAQGAPAGTKNLTFTVTLSKASGQTVTVNYATADGTARSTSDYVAENGVLRFLPNTGLTRQISITINGDTLVEGDETLYVLLSGDTNASIGRGRGVGIIINDDAS